MIKKLLSLAACAIIAMPTFADTQAMSLADLGAGWGSSYDASTKTITYDSAWSGRGWWLAGTDPADWSEWEDLVVKIQPVDFDVKIVVEYTTGEKDGNNWTANGSSEAMIAAGDTEGTVALNAEKKGKVMQVYLQNSKAGNLTLEEAYLQNGAEKPTEVTLFEGSEDMSNNYYPGLQINKSKIIASGAGSVMEIYFTKTGDGISYKLCSNYTNDVVPSFKDVKDFNPEYSTVWTSAESPIKFTFTKEDIEFLETTGDSSFRISGGGDGFVITKVVLLAPKDDPTAIDEISIEGIDENAPVEYYNIQGVRIANPENGLYIRKQGNKVTKIIL